MTPGSPPKPPASGYSKLLIASLALNLLFIGLFAGAAIVRHRWHGPRDASLSDPSLRGFMFQLPKERRESIRVSSEQVRQAWRPLRRAVQDARAAYNAAMYAQPIDTGLVEKTLGELIAAESAARRAGIAVLTSAIAQMTPDERKRFQEFRRRHEPRFGHRFRQGDDDNPAPPAPK